MTTNHQINKNMEDYYGDEEELDPIRESDSIDYGGSNSSTEQEPLVYTGNNLEPSPSGGTSSSGETSSEEENQQPKEYKDRYAKDDFMKSNKYKHSLNWSKNAAEKSIKVSGGTPGSEMQGRINESKKNAVKDWQKEEVLKWGNTEKTEWDNTVLENLNESLNMKSAGTSMGSGKLPIGNNVKKSGSQIGKHMNKYGV